MKKAAVSREAFESSVHCVVLALWPVQHFGRLVIDIEH